MNVMVEMLVFGWFTGLAVSASGDKPIAALDELNVEESGPEPVVFTVMPGRTRDYRPTSSSTPFG